MSVLLFEFVFDSDLYWFDEVVYVVVQIVVQYVDVVDCDVCCLVEVIEVMCVCCLFGVMVLIYFGGVGVLLEDIVLVCLIFGQVCVLLVMVFVMYQIQVVCIVNYVVDQGWYKLFL